MQARFSRLLREIQRATSERAIAFALMDHGPAAFGAFATGLYSMFDRETPSEMHLRGLSEPIADMYEAEGRVIDPLFRWVWEHHAAAVMDLESFRGESPRLQGVVDAAVRLGGGIAIRDYMAAPIVVGGGIVGMMHFASAGSRKLDVTAGSALSAHVSARVSVLRAIESFPGIWSGALTEREQEMAVLAARGLTTRDMARSAGISPNTVKKYLKQLYSKLGVASRIELAAVLLRGPDAMVERSTDLATPGRRVVRKGVAAYFY